MFKDKDDKICQVVEISPTYATEINIKQDFKNEEENRRKLQGYVPNKSSRIALKLICEGLHPTSTQRVHLITGAYGTGKSHFGLVVANFISRDISDQDFKPLFDKLNERDKELADHIIKARQAVKKFLLVIPEPHWDPEGFHHSLLTALAEALEREGINFRPKTHFTAALERIESWRQKEKEAYEKLEKALLRHQATVQQLIDGLKAHKENFYKLFTQVHQEVAYGAEFDPVTKADPREILSDTIKYLRSTGEWSGIFIIYDEFARYLSQMANDPESFEAQNLQKFAEYCKRTYEDQCHFMVIAHQTLADYARGKRSQEEWQKIYGRFISGEHSLTVSSSEYEMEELINTIVVQKRENPLWAAINHHADFNLIADLIQERKLYSQQGRKWIEENLLQGTYPLHPYTTFVLPWISERVGQSHRTLFTFFGDDNENGLRHFVRISPVMDKDERLCLYSPDKLIHYFESAILKHDEYKIIMQSRSNALADVGDNPQATRIINVIAILMILRHPNLPPTKEVIVEALNIPSYKKEDIYAVLEELVHGKEILRYRKFTGCYELPRSTSEISVNEAIRGEKQKLVDQGFDCLTFLKEIYPLQPIIASQYAQAHFVQRQAVRDYVTVSSLSNPKPFLDRIESWYRPDRGKYEGDLLILYVLTDSDVEVKNAKDYINKIDALKHQQLIIAIPKQPASIIEPALELKAALNIENLGEAKQQVDLDDLEVCINDAKELLTSRITELARSDKLIWYCNGNVTSNLMQGGEETHISQVMEQVFSKTPIVKDDAIANPIKASDKRKSHRQEVTNTLLQTRGPFEVSKVKGGPKDQILRACIIDTELAEKVLDKGKSGTYEIREDPPQRSPIKSVWDFLKNIIIQYQAAVGKDIPFIPIPVGNIVQPLINPPYGLSSQLIEILLAAFLRRHINEWCLVKGSVKDRSDLIPISGEILTNIARIPNDYILIYTEVTKPEENYLNKIIEIFPKDNSQSGISLWESAKIALLEWFSNLPQITQTIVSDVSDTNKPYAEFISLIQDTQKTSQAKDMLKRFLPEALGLSPLIGGFSAIIQAKTENYDGIIECLKEIRNGFSAYAQTVENILVEKLCELFNAKGKTHPELDDALKNWYKSLSEFQRLHSFSGDEAYLIDAIKSDGSVIERTCYRLPTKMELGSYLDWDEDKTETLIARVKAAKLSIESYKISAPPPISSPEDVPQEPIDPIERTIFLVRSLFSELNLSRAEQEQVLWKLLEDLEKSDD